MKHSAQNFPSSVQLLYITAACRKITRPHEHSYKARLVERDFHRFLHAYGVHFTLWLRKLGDIEMARFRNSTFASIRVTASQEAAFTEWVASSKEDGLAWFNIFTGDGFKVSVSWVFDQNAFCVSLIGTDNTKDHRDMVMTSWSDDLEEAIRLAAFKHYVLCEGKEWPSQETGKRWG